MHDTFNQINHIHLYPLDAYTSSHNAPAYTVRTLLWFFTTPLPLHYNRIALLICKLVRRARGREGRKAAGEVERRHAEGGGGMQAY